jgi:hypothetical protein
MAFLTRSMNGAPVDPDDITLLETAKSKGRKLCFVVFKKSGGLKTILQNNGDYHTASEAMRALIDKANAAIQYLFEEGAAEEKFKLLQKADGA